MGREEKSQEKSQERKTSDEIRKDLRRRFGPAGLDPDRPEVELEIELVAQVARVAEALELSNKLTATKALIAEAEKAEGRV